MLLTKKSKSCIILALLNTNTTTMGMRKRINAITKIEREKAKIRRDKKKLKRTLKAKTEEKK